MVIGERFAWGHLQKTAGNATLGMFHLFPDLVLDADSPNEEKKHASAHYALTVLLTSQQVTYSDLAALTPHCEPPR